MHNVASRNQRLKKVHAVDIGNICSCEDVSPEVDHTVAVHIVVQVNSDIGHPLIIGILNAIPIPVMEQRVANIVRACLVIAVISPSVPTKNDICPNIIRSSKAIGIKRGRPGTSSHITCAGDDLHIVITAERAGEDKVSIRIRCRCIKFVPRIWRSSRVQVNCQTCQPWLCGIGR